MATPTKLEARSHATRGHWFSNGAITGALKNGHGLKRDHAIPVGGGGFERSWDSAARCGGSTGLARAL